MCSLVFRKFSEIECRQIVKKLNGSWKEFEKIAPNKAKSRSFPLGCLNGN